MSFNKITLIGNLGGDPETRFLENGMQLTNFSVATQDKVKNSTTNKYEDHTEWFKVTLFGKPAESAAKYLAKGSLVYVEGRLRTNVFTNKKGETKVSLEVTGSDVKFLSRNEKAQSASASTTATTNHSDNDVTGEDIPF